MPIEFDPRKGRTQHRQTRCVSGPAPDLEILAYVEDERNAYREVRYRAWGLIDGKAHCLAFTYRNGQVRAISLRRAHKKEMIRYAP